MLGATLNNVAGRLESPTLRASSLRRVLMLEYDDSTALPVIGAKLMLAQAKCEIVSNDEIRLDSPTLCARRPSSTRSVFMLSHRRSNANYHGTSRMFPSESFVSEHLVSAVDSPDSRQPRRRAVVKPATSRCLAVADQSSLCLANLIDLMKYARISPKFDEGTREGTSDVCDVATRP